MPGDLSELEPIVQDLSWQNYPFERVPEQLLLELCSASPTPTWANALECFLQVTDAEPLGAHCVRNGELKRLLPDFIGAVYSRRLLGPEVSLQVRYNIVRPLFRALQALEEPAERLPRSKQVYVPASLAKLYPKVDRAPLEAEAISRRFELRELNESAVYIWRGWRVTSAVGASRWLPLRAVFEKFGLLWTNRFHELVRIHARGQRGGLVPGLPELCAFLASREDVTEQGLLSRSSATKMWHDFWTFYCSSRARTVSSRVLLRAWANNFANFAERVLIASGLFAAPYGAFPGPRHPKSRLNAHATAPTDDVPETLLVDIPQDMTDKAAWDFLLVQIPNAVTVSRKWAESQAAEHWARHTRRKKWASEFRAAGRTGPSELPFRQRVSSNTDELKRAAALYEELGHLNATSGGNLRTLLPTPLRATAEALGFPQAQTLLAHAALLVLEHQEVTAGYLEWLEMWDKNGKLVGLNIQNGATYLVGRKHRRRGLAEMSIKLTRRSKRAVLQVLAMTRPLRQYMRAHGLEDWRYLFLTSHGFGVPTRVTKFTSDTSIDYRLARLSEQFEKHCNLSAEESRRFCSRFSLKTLRTTCALQVFVDTHSEKKMSEALGHAEFDRTLLARYLPPVLVSFFRARWVRAFQAGLLSVVLQGSEFRHRAVGVQSEEHLQRILSSMNLQPLEEMLSYSDGDAVQTDADADASGANRLVFNANSDTLHYVVASSRSGPASDGEGLYWKAFSTHMLGVLEARRGLDPELDSLLARAKENPL